MKILLIVSLKNIKSFSTFIRRSLWFILRIAPRFSLGLAANIERESILVPELAGSCVSKWRGLEFIFRHRRNPAYSLSSWRQKGLVIYMWKVKKTPSTEQKAGKKIVCNRNCIGLKTRRWKILKITRIRTKFVRLSGGRGCKFHKRSEELGKEDPEEYQGIPEEENWSEILHIKGKPAHYFC